jgi:tetratricopeptide (TPR) repeat protein
MRTWCMGTERGTAKAPAAAKSVGALLLTSLLLLVPVLACAGISLTASLDRNPVAVGQSSTLTVEIQGAQDVPAPAIPVADGLTVRYVGPSTQVSFVNGQITSTITHRYNVTPSREGTFTLGPVTVDYGGKQYRAAEMQVQAVTPSKAAQALPGRDQIRLDISAARKRVYVQEPVPVTITLFVGGVRVDDLQYPVLPAEGFTSERFAEPKQTREVVRGQATSVLRFNTTIVPLRPGTTNLGPAHISMSLVVPGRRSRDSFFDGFFGDFRKESIEVASDAFALEVLPLPDAGRPADFHGAIGRFTLDASAKPADLHVGDPVTVSVTVGGEGNFNAVTAPVLDAGADFKAYPPQETTAAGAGQKTFEQVLIPLRPDVRAVPAVHFSFFNTESGRYETLSRGPFALTVLPAAEAQEARVVQSESAERSAPRPAEKLGRDLVYIKDAPGTLLPRGQRFFAQAWFWVFLLLSTAAYAGLWVRARQRDRLRADPRLARFARAGRAATAELAAARALLQSGEESRFDDTLSRTVREYLAAKLDLPPGAVEAENVARRLGANGAAPEVAARVERVLGMLERVRYAPSAAAHSEREEALRLAEEIVAALEKQRYRAVSARAAASALLVAALAAGCIAPGSGAAEVAASNPTAAFYEANSLYGKGQFDEAAKAYESVLASGQESAPLYYNLGNAYMKSGKPGQAILNYERARRLAPGDVDVATNLRFALEQQKISGEEPLWRRLVLPLAERAGSASLAGVCVALYAALLLALALRLTWPQTHQPATRVALVLGALLLFAGANLGYRVARYDLAEDAVVTRAGETPVRFEPSPDGTTHFSVPEGTLLQILESRDGWLQVARPDGRRGWVEASACTRL